MSDTRKYPLVPVRHEVARNKWDRWSYLECGHIHTVVMSYTGAHPAKRRRCRACYGTKLGHRAPPDMVWNRERVDATEAKLLPNEKETKCAITRRSSRWSEPRTSSA